MGAPGTTPGPWMAAAGPSGVVGWPVVQCGQGGGRSICSLAYIPSDGRIMDESRANGHQIAASPRLYDALKNLLKATQPQGLENRVYLAEAIHEADAALAEARGEKPEQDR